VDAAELRDRLINAMATDLDSDGFAFTVSPPAELAADEAGRFSWRFSVQASLAGRPFDGLKLDVAPRAEELDPTERIVLRSSLSFAGIEGRSVELIDVNRHAAEKIHAYTRVYGERPSTRVRDLADLVLLIENDLLDHACVAAAIDAAFAQRMTHPVPAVTASWSSRSIRCPAKLCSTRPAARGVSS
jgi:hypothetical protein